MASGCIGSAAQSENVIASAQKLSGGTWVRKAKGLKYRKANGKFVKNAWVKISGDIYYIGSDRYVRTGWFTYKDSVYYADKDGKVYYKKWLTLKKSYYLSASGKRVEGRWLKIKKKYYYFNKNGRMLTNRFIGDYYVDSSGVRLSSVWVQKAGKRYYLDSNGKRVKNKWIKKKGKYYYMQSDGSMAVDCYIGQYYVGKDGVRVASGKVPDKFSGNYIFVGDSRMVGMDSAVSASDVTFIAKVNSGYAWLQSTADTSLRNALKAHPDARVILAHGVNDIQNVNSYISYYKQLIRKYTSAEFYILSVNPVDYEKALAHGYRWVTNDMIKSFNKSMKDSFGSRYIDTYTYLEKNGFDTNDGIHYLASTYQKLYRYIRNKMG